MKSSTITVLLALLLLFGVLTAHNFSLKAEYKNGNYKKAFPESTLVPLKDIKSLEIRSANLMRVRVQYGDRDGIWINDRLNERLQWQQNGFKLSLDLKKNANEVSEPQFEEVVVVLNSLEQVRTLDGVLSKDADVDDGGSLEISNLKLPHLELMLEARMNTNLRNNSFRNFKLTLGQGQFPAHFSMAGDNRIDTAYFDVRGQSSISLGKDNIAVPHFELSKDCYIQMPGELLRQLNK